MERHYMPFIPLFCDITKTFNGHVIPHVNTDNFPSYNTEQDQVFNYPQHLCARRTSVAERWEKPFRRYPHKVV